MSFIAWCGRPLTVLDKPFLEWHEKKFGPFGPYLSQRTSANTKCAECRRLEKEYLTFLKQQKPKKRAWKK